MMPKNMMEYLVAIIALVALGLSIAAIAKKCKDHFGAPGTCMNNGFNPGTYSPCGGHSCDTNDDNRYCFSNYGCDQCVQNGPTPPPGAPCNYKLGDKCTTNDIDSLYYHCDKLTCLIHDENTKQGKVVRARNDKDWDECGKTGSGCFALSKNGSGGGCCKNEFKCAGRAEGDNQPPYVCQQNA